MATQRTATKNDNNDVKDGDDDYDKSMFDHCFEGWSIWIEPEENDIINNTMKELSGSCGGESKGVFPFIPHLTLLYNLPPTIIANSTADDGAAKQEEEGLRLLHLCWDEFVLKEPKHSCRPCCIVPSQWYYFHYPKSADNGRGFGCSIAMVLIRQEKWLMGLQQICQKVLGPDERLSNFIPHLSFVYAPEIRSQYLENYVAIKQSQQVLLLTSNTDDTSCDDKEEKEKESASVKMPEERTDHQHADTPITTNTEEGNGTSKSRIHNDGNHAGVGLPVKYLSLWSTQGCIQDWYRIAKIQIQ